MEKILYNDVIENINYLNASEYVCRYDYIYKYEKIFDNGQYYNIKLEFSDNQILEIINNNIDEFEL